MIAYDNQQPAQHPQDTFTAPQQARGKLLQRQWQELLEIVEWISPTQDQALSSIYRSYDDHAMKNMSLKGIVRWYCFSHPLGSG